MRKLLFYFCKMITKRAAAVFIVVCLSGNLYAQENDNILKLGLLPNLSSMEILQTFSPFIKALEDETKMDVKAISGKDYSAVIEMLKNKKIDVCPLGGISLLAAADTFGVKIFARTLETTRPDKPPNEAYHSVIITRKDSGINSLEYLKGKRFSFTDPKSSSGFLFPMVALIRHGIRLENLGKVVYVKKHPNSLLAVFNRQTDAGALSEDIFIRGTGVNPNELKMLWKSEPIMRGPWVARNDFPDEKLAIVKSAFLNISRQKDAKQIFAKSFIKGFVPAKMSDYDNFRDVMKLKASLEK